LSSNLASDKIAGLFIPIPLLLSSAIVRVRSARWRQFSFAALPALFALLILSTPTVCAQTYIFGRAHFAVGTEPSSVAAGDFNGDGIRDLVITNSASNTISVLLGNPDGTFQPEVIYPSGPDQSHWRRVTSMGMETWISP